MTTDKADGEPVTGEARLRIEGGLAHFPGLAKEHTVCFGDLTSPQRAELAELADQAGFFDCAPAENRAQPDARTYTVGLTIGERSREICVAEPITDPAMAKLVSVVRRLSKQRGDDRKR
ncbi:hypothetical protein ASE70_16315 [Sphingomonas sp. Leaf22]|uniref:protealysin inhibitor emfourin n=1 Tax=Sphingomonas sp. Leaf22 TaxID=1735687 RepID=UPI000702177E|nr:protealysin inhibitor emfourin [Sphingomonas sp. Leaf22]KQM89540.1 hypothetical protein ASE70_16315 [Sphingomonas sp. Leaf22]